MKIRILEHEVVQLLKDVSHGCLVRPASSEHSEINGEDGTLLSWVLGKPEKEGDKFTLVDLKTFELRKRPGNLQVVEYEKTLSHGLDPVRVSKASEAKPGNGIRIMDLTNNKKPEGGWEPTHVVVAGVPQKTDEVRIVAIKDGKEEILPPEMAVHIYTLSMIVARKLIEKKE